MIITDSHLRISQIAATLSAHSTRHMIYNMVDVQNYVRSKYFPEPVQIYPVKIWRRDEVEEWIDDWIFYYDLGKERNNYKRETLKRLEPKNG